MGIEYEWMRTFREYEIGLVVPMFPSGKASVLEIGAGAGWQARYLDSLGFVVTAIEVKNGFYEDRRVWPIEEYDGKHIPFPDDHFDAVFSSCVLEHIPNVEEFQHEIMRVLKPNGVGIHVLPTCSWRLWTSVAFYLKLFGGIMPKLWRKMRSTKLPQNPAASVDCSDSPHGLVHRIRWILFPHRHGATGNWVSELWLFSRYRWRRVFQRTGWLQSHYTVNHLARSGKYVFGNRLPLRVRTWASYLLGSSSQFFVLVSSKSSHKASNGMK